MEARAKRWSGLPTRGFDSLASRESTEFGAAFCRPLSWPFFPPIEFHFGYVQRGHSFSFSRRPRAKGCRDFRHYLSIETKCRHGSCRCIVNSATLFYYRQWTYTHPHSNIIVLLVGGDKPRVGDDGVGGRIFHAIRLNKAELRSFMICLIERKMLFKWKARNII